MSSSEEGFVVGYVVKIFDDHSLINTIINTDFSIPGIDKYGNQYLITSNREELIVNSIVVEEINLNIDYISCSPFRIPAAKLAAAQAQLNK